MIFSHRRLDATVATNGWTSAGWLIEWVPRPRLRLTARVDGPRGLVDICLRAPGPALGQVLAPAPTRAVTAVFTAVAGADFLQFLYARLQQSTM